MSRFIVYGLILSYPEVFRASLKLLVIFIFFGWAVEWFGRLAGEPF
jgi:hypothetical protein